jgi:carbamate kinase
MVAFLAAGVLAVHLASGRSAPAAPTVPTTSIYDYKVELVKHKKDLEALLKDDGRNGWRVQKVVAEPSNNEIVVVLEKASSP